MKTTNYKNKLIIAFGFIILIGNACNDLDLAPLSSASTENWYSSGEEFDMSMNYFYGIGYWDQQFNLEAIDLWTDDLIYRDRVGALDGGSLDASTSFVKTLWGRNYQQIQNANRVIQELQNAEGISDDKKEQLKAEAMFHRAARYSNLIFHWGDVPFYTNVLTVDEAFSLSRKDKEEILQEIYKDFDFASQNLPLTYSGFQRATKGAALAMKSRIALYMGDYEVARDAAKACIDLGIYELHPKYEDVFAKKTGLSKEIIFAIPRSKEYGVVLGGHGAQLCTRTPGGFVVRGPSWQLLASYLCTDGLPIDESPLFDPQNPFENRDPRCNKTIIEFGSQFAGVVYEPHPDSLVVFNSNTGSYVTNKDSRGNDRFASFNGLAVRKWINGEESDWLNSLAEPLSIVVRYADVLLYYAESKIELNEIDQSVLDAINHVRARAYEVDISSSAYPKVTVTDQNELRRQLRVERRMEFGFEGLRRYCDLVRWRLAEKVMNMWTYGILSSADDLRNKVVEPGLWFWPDTPPIDEDGIAHFEETNMFQEGRIRRLAKRSWPDRQYLWPIPTSEIQINKNLVQNPQY
ncbi:RagB/SusD family nutrient uptake outer membrane protein [Maribellus comscasis]|uniref:RagB/SusD family nutrient uptake outer membrane protein n=1 Tax=Maribellus comscasis TaxID=2681766 RepID=A0A6I6JX64_9BACT|nr:RagB/SusD family nutrient uptake outer membrane protein [Maribellus comscasis]QGY47736.1 RagB/SusD family nutrient uptake outer membrane protein [Maribellus comscasis]